MREQSRLPVIRRPNNQHEQRAPYFRSCWLRRYLELRLVYASTPKREKSQLSQTMPKVWSWRVQPTWEDEGGRCSLDMWVAKSSIKSLVAQKMEAHQRMWVYGCMLVLNKSAVKADNGSLSCHRVHSLAASMNQKYRYSEQRQWCRRTMGETAYADGFYDNGRHGWRNTLARMSLLSFNISCLILYS
jgi:hypothetical protein